MDRVFELFPRLEERIKQEAGTMSGGEQQMLAIGRALMSRPKLLLLDEPSMGLAPVLVERIFQTIQEINQQGTTILLVEQNANVALEIATRGYVLETGTIVNEASGRPAARGPEGPRSVPGRDLSCLHKINMPWPALPYTVAGTCYHRVGPPVMSLSCYAPSLRLKLLAWSGYGFGTRPAGTGRFAGYRRRETGQVQESVPLEGGGD